MYRKKNNVRVKLNGGELWLFAGGSAGYQNAQFQRSFQKTKILIKKKKQQKN